MKRLLTPASIVVSTLLSACATTSQTPQGICAELAAFANSTRAGHSQVVVLMTEWGPRPPPRGIGTLTYDSTHCVNSFTPAGERLCTYLQTRSAREFSFGNFRATMACAEHDAGRVHNTGGSEEFAAAHTFRSIPGVEKRVELTVSQMPGKSAEGATIVFSARRAVR